MIEEEAIATVSEGLSGTKSIPIKLRMGRGLDRPQLSAVKEAMRFLIGHWKGRDTVPKQLAAAFIDLQGGMQDGRERYTAEEQDEIEDAAVELINLAYELLEE